ncbi:MAG: prephenate dehydrogenase/arogenate dehydrogenase family protein, partial [Actinobacteria bacterium]|nr:prephenate dehydrogenase/arogenate dehydrogenase family protein [Actinomycetota bacterium]NIS35380.1 prephenate dehydrogenase/arogenate dehydrogenase family protein [Actinomycetota bacterium]NIT98098.1 prephenate dehydrogenase/arogenate dehydrogenase family protein [Actinomycetota bacterium]NIU21731.1 prephenate dehydrogenase/arogenate dehydrogenase family protein [Actinomycetota bacterium]NIU70072.1 prephenate dehydrogenase/arogenate dehydrogenase family protein [Actinomycetota bacterium]
MARAAILGTGLIGASVGIALGRAGWQRTGWDPDRSALDKAMRFGAVDIAAEGGAVAVDGADLIVLAGPVAAVVDTLGGL